ncbi:right-handed parallel beta-helix repeat-containing protein [Janthinobacterium agaricidamnosum]|nr:right-handed parallel beta-helix repeat-containing protein [Janthinobacterium agaricidamnosum]
MLLASCGGGGGESSAGGSPAAPDPVVVAGKLSISGTAATGLAIAGANVSAKCQSGSAAAITKADGSYSFVIADGKLPCLLELVQPADGLTLHTVATGNSTTLSANITPLTNMVVARAARKEPAVLFAAFDAAASAALTGAALKAAQSDVTTVLSGMVETGSVADFIATPLKAATPDQPAGGDAHDKILDALGARFNRAQLTQIVASLSNIANPADIKQTLHDMTGTPPLADAGVVQSVLVGATVALDGSGSSVDLNQSPIYSWTLIAKPAGSSATLSSASAVRPSFTADVAGTYIAGLSVSDGKINSGMVPVTITASTGNAAPVAHAGWLQNVGAGTLVTLDGSASSDANHDKLSYAWSLTAKPAGSTAVLSSTSSVQPTFTADLAGTYVASLVVNDGKADSQTASATVNVGNALGNIISRDTVLSADKSPYFITDTIQIAYGATLTVGPGVTLRSQGLPIYVYGTLKVAGNASAYARLDNVQIYQAGASEAQSSSIQISYARMNGGKLMQSSGGAMYGNVVLTDSVLSSVNTFGEMYLWYPVKDSYIERNIFRNSGGLSIGVDARSVAKKVYVRNNVFTSIWGTAVTNWASYGGETTVVSGNSFLDHQEDAILRLRGSASAMTATGNYWGTTDAAAIQARIDDKTNNPDAGGLIPFLPALAQPDPATPTYP